MPGAIRLAIALLAVMLGPGCGDGPRPPALKGAPDEPRIVVLSPALGVVLHDLGLREHIVGRHGYDTVLDQSIPVCGEQNGVNYEALLRARPTHVITEWGTRELPAKLAGLAESNGWVLRDFRMLTLGDVDAAATALGGMLPQASPSARISRMHELAGAAPPDRLWSGRVLLLMDVSPIAAIGPGSAHHELLVRV
ncbi:MAG TPA: hypothetical protein VFF69_03280, partial [Phycisphaerales bacterium]|nr:hypothetical protein [Phycisphaerales bacterium]